MVFTLKHNIISLYHNTWSSRCFHMHEALNPLNYPVMSILQMRKVKSGELKRSFRIIYHVHGKAWARGGIARLSLIP